MTVDLAGYDRESFAYHGVERTVYCAGSGPAVIVMAEMPGITPRVLAFAERVVAVGCSVWIPQLFGTPGRAPSASAYARSLPPACVSKEFAAFATGRTAPVTDWLRALAAHAHQRCGGPGVGAIGMCFTGGFALGMMVDDRMLAPVLSQPSLPLAGPGPLGRRARADVHLNDADRVRIAARAADGVCVLGLRFTGDSLSPPERFAALRDLLGDAFVGIEIDSSPGNAHGIRRRAHSVVTEDLVDEPGHPTHEALEAVLDLFRSRLVDAE